MRNVSVGVAFVTLFGCVADDRSDQLNTVEQAVTRTRTPGGWAETISLVDGVVSEVDRTNPFFQRVGSNARTCETCHEAVGGWSVTAGAIQSRFNSNGGTGPIFMPHDGSNNPAGDHSTVEQRRLRYDLLLRRGLVQMPQSVTSSEFHIEKIEDPYGSSTPASFLRFRRPSTIANVRFAQTITWNGAADSVRNLLLFISGAATQVHLQGSIDEATKAEMADLMESVVFAQAEDLTAGRLDVEGARGGVLNLANETFVAGANDPLSGGFDRNVFTLYGAWVGRGGTTQEAARAAIARGEAIFNTKEFDISGVAGLTDVDPLRPVIRGTCSTCHAVPNIGNHPVFRPMDIGTVDRAPRATELPLLHVRRSGGTAVRVVTDLGRAGDTGRWDDIGKISVPRLRGVGARAPYFHNGFASNFQEVIAFYRGRFNITLTSAEIDDLAAFLRAL